MVFYLLWKSENEYFDNLAHLVSTNTINSKLPWKTTKLVLKLGKPSTSIPTLFMNIEFAEDNLQKAYMLNAYFTYQTFVSIGLYRNSNLSNILSSTLKFPSKILRMH